MQEKLTHLEALVGMTTTGLLIGLGQLLSSDERISTRLVIGRAMSSTGLSLVAGLILIQFPKLGLIPLVGLSALIASLGTSALERLLQRFLGIKK